MKKNKTYQERVIEKVVINHGMSISEARFIRMQRRLRIIESVEFTEWDIRGLSKREKDFIRENDMKCYIDLSQEPYKWKMERGYTNNRYYLAIKRDLTSGRPRLYAQHKDQWINPNGHNIGNRHNYEYWLIVDLSHGYDISIHNYELRANETMWPVSTWG